MLFFKTLATIFDKYFDSLRGSAVKAKLRLHKNSNYVFFFFQLACQSSTVRIFQIFRDLCSRPPQNNGASVAINEGGTILDHTTALRSTRNGFVTCVI